MCLTTLASPISTTSLNSSAAPWPHPATQPSPQLPWPSGAQNSSATSAAVSATSNPSPPPPQERSSMVACSPFPTLSATKSSIPSATSSCTISEPETASS